MDCSAALLDTIVTFYRSKEVSFQFRGFKLRLAISYGLFSSNGIDTGTVLLLKTLSKLLDAAMAAGRALPLSILDAGSGTGVLGICAAKALQNLVPQLQVRSQDRDELARCFTEYNARINGISADVLCAHTEPLLAGDPACYDLILSNIPAKAGKPVLEDFILRALSRLNPSGHLLFVAVSPLTAFFTACIASSGADLAIAEETHEYSVFLLQKAENLPLQAAFFPIDFPCYIRNRGSFALEGIEYKLLTVHGAAGFDNPGQAVRLAAKLTVKLIDTIKTALAAPQVLMYEDGQGHFPVWFSHLMNKRLELVLSGRNILALGASRHNLSELPTACSSASITVIPTPYLFLKPAKDTAVPLFAFIACFPDIVPETDWPAISWKSFAELLSPGGIVIITVTSTCAQRLDKTKPPGFIRLGSIKREGFRALAYQKATTLP